MRYAVQIGYCNQILLLYSVRCVRHSFLAVCFHFFIGSFSNWDDTMFRIAGFFQPVNLMNEAAFQAFSRLSHSSFDTSSFLLSLNFMSNVKWEQIFSPSRHISFSSLLFPDLVGLASLASADGLVGLGDPYSGHSRCLILRVIKVSSSFSQCISFFTVST